MSKKIYYDVRGAQCIKCAGLVLVHPFEEGEQHRAMANHVCAHDVAQERLEEFGTQLEEMLQQNDFYLGVGMSEEVWLELRDRATGVTIKLGSELG